MRRATSLVLSLLAFSIGVGEAGAQLVLRNDVSGWGWLAIRPEYRAVVQLGYGSTQTGRQGRLDSRVAAALGNRGLARVTDSSGFDPAENQLLAECSGMEWTASDSSRLQYVLHVELSWWDRTRLSGTEIFEAITASEIAPNDLPQDVFVDECARQVGDLLLQLGYGRG